MKKSLVLFLFSVLMPLVPPAFAAPEAAADKPAAIRQLMQVMGADNLSAQFGQAMTQQIYQVLKTTRPELPPEALGIVQDEIGRLLAEDGDKLLGQIAAIYDRNFSEGEIRELTAFYQTELGRKTVTVTPLIIQESMALGKSWGQSAGPKLMGRLEARFKQTKDGNGKQAPAKSGNGK